jgi:hypothetical protein
MGLTSAVSMSTREQVNSRESRVSKRISDTRTTVGLIVAACGGDKISQPLKQEARTVRLAELPLYRLRLTVGERHL